MIHHQVVIVGGGEAGLSVAYKLLRKSPGLDVAIVEPSQQHYYQRMWLMAGSGVINPEASRREKEALIPKDVVWIKDAVKSFEPANNILHTAGGQTITYQYLVVVPGIETKWDLIPGLRESLGHNGVCSSYSHQALEATWAFIRDFSGGVAIFTQPSGEIKCPTGSQEMCYLAEEHFRYTGVRDRSQLILATGAPALYPIARFAHLLDKIAKEKRVIVNLRLNLVEVRAAAKQAVFHCLDTGEERVIGFDLLHVAPPMGPFDFVAQSEFADSNGWVDVDQHTLQQTRFPNVFSMGDTANLPTTKTAAAVRQQAPVLVDNLLSALAGQPLTAHYGGYALNNIVTGYKSVFKAETDYCGAEAEDCAARLLQLAPKLD